MFTGLIESVGRVEAVVQTASCARVRISTALAPDLRVGDSLAVDGVCLTVASLDEGQVHVDVGPETMRVTTLGSMCAGQPVNLERAMRADGRFGGHLVQGHVDGVGLVSGIRDEDEAHWVTIGFDAALAACCIPKGSIAVDGISLTIAALRDREFDVMIVPFTWAHTTVGARRVGDRVNLECDMVGKYVARAAQIAQAAL